MITPSETHGAVGEERDVPENGECRAAHEGHCRVGRRREVADSRVRLAGGLRGDQLYGEDHEESGENGRH